ncbi:MAG: ATP-binding cassette domain-containing protein [Chlorobium sp.]|nr:ATP-binding cassette domain-containing protein [Chlorobium sp.]
MGINLENGLHATLVKKLPSYTLAVSISCPPGETVVLTGPSGSGKTTVLRCLAGLEKLDDGHVHFQGRCWNNAKKGVQASPQSREVGFLSQEYALFPHMTLAENVLFAMRRPENPGELLDAMGIGHLQNKHPHQVSGGERQRAALCQTLARRPKLLLLDEPFSALDIENRHALRQKLLAIQKQWNLPIIQVTHDLIEAMALSARIISLQNGSEDSTWLQKQKALIAKDLQLIRQEFAAKPIAA